MSSSFAKASVAKNTAWLLITEFASRLIVFFAVVALTNYLGDEIYGELAYAFSIANLVVVLSDFGLSTYLVKELARDLSKTASTITTLLGLKLLLSFASAIVLVVAGYVVGNVAMYLLCLAGGSILVMNARVFVEAFFRAHQKMHLEAVTKIFSGITLAAGLGGALYLGLSVYRIADVYMLVSTIAVIISMIVLYTRIAKFSLRWKWPEYRPVLYAAWPFAASMAINYIFNYMDSAMLGAWNLKTAVAWYTAAYKPIFFITSIAGLIISAFFPVIAKLYATHDPQLQPTVQRLLKINIILALPMALGGTILAEKIISFLYTPEYAPATLAFQILCWSTALIYVWAVYGNSLQACDGQKLYMRGFVWGAVINIGLNIVFIPYFSLYGAAAATALTQLFLVGFMRQSLQMQLSLKLWAVVWRPLLAAGIMAIVLLQMQSLSLWLNLSAGIVIYGIMLIALRGVRRDEIISIAAAWRK